MIKPYGLVTLLAMDYTISLILGNKLALKNPSGNYIDLYRQVPIEGNLKTSDSAYDNTL